MKTKIILSLLFLVTLAACRYEDGPLISVRTVDRRLQGDYHAETFLFDGENAIQIWKDSICNDYVKIRLQDPGGAKFHLFSTTKKNDLSGGYEFSQNKENLQLLVQWVDSCYTGFGPFKMGCSSSWNIHKLSNKKLWMQTTFKGHDYYLKLFKIKDYPKY
jgi:hypothetical protein